MHRQRRNHLDSASAGDEPAAITAAADGVAVGLVLVLGGRGLLEDALDLALHGRPRLVERLLAVELLEGVHLAVVGGGDVRVGNLKEREWQTDRGRERDAQSATDVTLSWRNCGSCTLIDADSSTMGIGPLLIPFPTDDGEFLGPSGTLMRKRGRWLHRPAPK